MSAPHVRAGDFGALQRRIEEQNAFMAATMPRPVLPLLQGRPAVQPQGPPGIQRPQGPPVELNQVQPFFLQRVAQIEGSATDHDVYPDDQAFTANVRMQALRSTIHFFRRPNPSIGWEAAAAIVRPLTTGGAR